jgi:outer membrane biogenesis lipoprotein LolB
MFCGSLMMSALSACGMPGALTGSAAMESLSPGTGDRQVEKPGCFALRARFSLVLAASDTVRQKTPRQFTGRFVWWRSASADEWLFSDPLGRGVARLHRRAGGHITLEMPGKEEAAALTGETIFDQLEATLGIPLPPLTDLADWLLARPNADAIVDRDGMGRLSRARVLGWRLNYRYMDEGAALPAQLEASYENIRLKIAIEHWESECHDGDVRA